MKYLIKAGSLYQIDNGRPGTKLACLKSPYYPVKKTILSPDGRIRLFAEIRPSGNREQMYILSDSLNQIILSGSPGYSKNLTISSEPHLNQIKITLEHRIYNLFMKNTQECLMMDENSWVSAKLTHRGTGGGWLLEADPVFSPYILMGLFIFCRYLDKENEFLTE